MNDEVALPMRPAAPEAWPAAPRWSPLLVAVVAGLGVAAFVVGLPPVTYLDNPTPMTCVDVDVGSLCTDVNPGDTTSEECGSLFLPDIVTTDSLDECAAGLAPRRLAIGLLTAGTVVLAVLGAKTSGSVGRKHTRTWEAFLVIGVFAAFLAAWTLAAWAVTHLLAWEPS